MHEGWKHLATFSSESRTYSICSVFNLRKVLFITSRDFDSPLTRIVFFEEQITSSIISNMIKFNYEKGICFSVLHIPVIFNVTFYQRFIAKEEIAFIHDADSEAKKKELFAKVRSGKVRVLIGSTAKCGAGMNVQDKLVAIHHLYCPWRPGDPEQREGRIIRQGNENKDVDIFRYVTEAMFDAYLYQTIENKQQFVSQIMTSKSPVRFCEDVDEANVHDVTMTSELLTGEENEVYGDSGYIGADKCEDSIVRNNKGRRRSIIKSIANHHKSRNYLKVGDMHRKNRRERKIL